MKRRILLPAAAAAALAAGFIVLPALAETKTYPLKNFSKIDASAGLRVVLKQGPHNVVVDHSKGEFDRVIVEVKGDTLKLGRKSGMFQNNSARVTVTVTAPDISAIDVSSGVSLEGDNYRFASLSLDVSSGGSVELSGSCRSLEVDASSGASVDADDLKCETVAANASSGGSVDAFASRSASGNASSGGSIEFDGNPQDFVKDTSSGGSVSRS
jgi:hypothetical protein